MVLAAALKRIGRVALLPLEIHGTSLQPNLLLIAKLVVLGLVLKQYYRLFPDSFAPLLPIFEWIPPPYLRRGFQGAFVIAAVGLCFNRAVRTNCLIIGGVFILGTLSSRLYYRNANVFVGLLFLMLGLQDRNKPPTLLAWQMGLMYFGAGLNKILEPDWRSGQYFAYFFSELQRSQWYTTAAAWLPSGWLAFYLCWHVIVSELAAGLLFFVPRFWALAVWLAAGVHAGASMMVASDYGIYLSAVLASYLFLLNWPRQLVVRVGPSVLARALVALHRLSHGHDPSVRYEVMESGDLQLRADGRSVSGLSAFGQLALWTPPFYALVMIVLSSVREWNAAVVRGSGIVVAIVLVVLAFRYVVLASTRSRRPSLLGRGIPES